ncbi:UVR domain [Macleaya cordata]|uniref:UVR domain n=1 Tax=Macleaya cordata TaxID=56857 RepID=A0A200R037_MACCD|nr:UVR domain [Macleaya cordata]
MASSSSLDTEQDEMASLFEGMVLFNPSQISDDVEDHHDTPPPPSSSEPPPPAASEAIQTTSTSSSSQPLDENLFSDLTLVTPIETLTLNPPSDSSSSSSSITTTTTTSTTTSTVEIPSVSRQVSRKKKKAAIKIGYGRDTSFLDEPSPSSSPSLSPSPSLPTIIQSNEPSPSNSLPTESESKSHLSIHSELASSEPTIDVEIEERNLNDADFKDSLGTETDPEPTTIRDLSPKEEGISDSVEEKLVQIKNRIGDKIESIRVMVDSASAKRKESAKKRRKAVENVNLSSIKYKELEKELEEACEAEDFERAERLSESLALVEKEKEGFTNALRDAEADCDADDLKMQEVLELQIAAEEEGVQLLEQFAKDAADNADLVLKNAEEFSSKEMADWQSSVENLEIKKMELEIETHLINDARLGLNESIELSIKDDKREKEVLCKKRDVLKEELEKLLSLVRQKEAEIAENDSYIQEVEKRIDAGVSGFHEAQLSIDMKYHNMQSLLSRMEEENEALSMKKKEVDDFFSQEEKRGAKLRELANASIAEAKTCKELVALRKSLALPILRSREDKVRLAKTEEKILEDIQMLRQEVSAARTSLQELSSTRSSIQQEITSSKQRVLFIDKRSPELEAEKKVAAAARNFKEAGRIAAETKTLSVEKESIQIKMEASISELEKIEEEIKNTVKRLHESEELILSKEKEAAMAGCERLHLVSAAAMAERSAALEFGDPEEANALLSEAEAADSQAAKLQEAYGLEEKSVSTSKHSITIELIAYLGGDQLAEMASSVSLSAA